MIEKLPQNKNKESESSPKKRMSINEIIANAGGNFEGIVAKTIKEHGDYYSTEDAIAVLLTKKEVRDLIRKMINSGKDTRIVDQRGLGVVQDAVKEDIEDGDYTKDWEEVRDLTGDFLNHQAGVIDRYVSGITKSAFKNKVIPKEDFDYAVDDFAERVFKAGLDKRSVVIEDDHNLKFFQENAELINKEADKKKLANQEDNSSLVGGNVIKEDGVQEWGEPERVISPEEKQLEDIPIEEVEEAYRKFLRQEYEKSGLSEKDFLNSLPPEHQKTIKEHNINFLNGIEEQQGKPNFSEKFTEKKKNMAKKIEVWSNNNPKKAKFIPKAFKNTLAFGGGFVALLGIGVYSFVAELFSEKSRKWYKEMSDSVKSISVK